MLAKLDLGTEVRTAPAVVAGKHTGGISNEMVYLAIGVAHVCIDGGGPGQDPAVKWRENISR